MNIFASINTAPRAYIQKLCGLGVKKTNQFPFAVLLLIIISNTYGAQTSTEKKAVLAVTQLKFVGIDEEQSQLATDAISNKIQSTQIYTVIERNQIAEILKEQSFQLSGACDPNECAVTVGKLLGAQKLVIGSIGVFPGLINTNLKLVNVTTGAVEKSFSDTRRGDFATLLLDILPGAAAKLAGLTENAEALGSFLLDPRDSKAYKTFQFGNAVWMAENLNHKTDSSLCYNNDTNNCAKYGRLYNKRDAMTACPSGWHISSDEEWKALENEAGVKNSDFENTFFDRCKCSHKFRSTAGWDNTSMGMEVKDFKQGTDDYGFKALPAGESYDGKSFSGDLGRSTWFLVTDAKNNMLCFRSLFHVSPSIQRGCVVSEKFKPRAYFSIRCVKDSQ